MSEPIHQSRKRIATPVTDALRVEGYDTQAELQELYDRLLDSHEEMERRAGSVIASEREAKWISVNDSMPDAESTVVAMRADGNAEVVIGEVLARGKDDFGGWKMTHWMPLPEAPK